MTELQTITYTQIKQITQSLGIINKQAENEALASFKLLKRPTIDSANSIITIIQAKYGKSISGISAQIFSKSTGIKDSATYDFKGGKIKEILANSDLEQQMTNAVNKNLKYAYSRTQTDNAIKHKCTFARVPMGKTCAFCTMIASRGFVYANKETAGEFNKYHGHCDCQIVASTDKNISIKGYDQEKYYKEYRNNVVAVKSADGKTYYKWKYSNSKGVSDYYLKHLSTDDLNQLIKPKSIYKSKKARDYIIDLNHIDPMRTYLYNKIKVYGQRNKRYIKNTSKWL
jgi:hypothetical protein